MPETLGTDPGTGIAGVTTTLSGSVAGAIGMITKANLAGAEAEEYDVTTMNGVNHYKRFISGLIDTKDLSLELIYEPTNMNLLLVAYGVVQNWTVTFPDGSTFVCSGFVKNVGEQIPVGDKITQTATIRFTGPPVFTAAIPALLSVVHSGTPRHAIWNFSHPVTAAHFSLSSLKLDGVSSTTIIQSGVSGLDATAGSWNNDPTGQAYALSIPPDGISTASGIVT